MIAIIIIGIKKDQLLITILTIESLNINYTVVYLYMDHTNTIIEQWVFQKFMNTYD